ncbi:MAG: protease-like activity factor CPAF [Chlamydiales bacterium]
MKKSYLLLLLTLICISFTKYQPPEENSLSKRRMLKDLDFIHSVFEVKYAPLQWKKDFADWDLKQAIEHAKQKVDCQPQPSVKDFHKILRAFFQSAKDYHVGIVFLSTEEASLPFLIKGAEGRYFISYVERDLLPYSHFPLGVGDEILTFDGRPIADVVEELRVTEFGGNTFETDQALAEMLLTGRCGTVGVAVPKGEVVLEGLRRGESRPTRVTLRWDYAPERIPDFSDINPVVKMQPSFSQWRMDPKKAVKEENFFEKMMVYSQWDRSHVGASLHVENKHSLGARTSFIPPLGRKIWSAPKDSPFDAYIFKSPENQYVGYIRIPHYIGDEEESTIFCELMKRFQAHTEALIIDQVNNPGGSVFYLYALAAAVADGVMDTPKHHLKLTQEEVYAALTTADALEGVMNERQAKEVLGESIGGYPVTMETVSLLREFCSFILSEWTSGKIYTDPTFLFGVNRIAPHPDGHYTKPILLLINSLDFSGGDFFPAILQDNRRVTILGTRTAGAGGYVQGTFYPNQTAIAGFQLTGSLAERVDKSVIENLGVKPDIAYALTARDLQYNYVEYVEKILQTVDSLIPKRRVDVISSGM